MLTKAPGITGLSRSLDREYKNVRFWRARHRHCPLSVCRGFCFFFEPWKRGKGRKTGKVEKAREKGKSEESLCQISVMSLSYSPNYLSEPFQDGSNRSTEVRCAIFLNRICLWVCFCHVLQTGLAACQLVLNILE